MGTTIQTVSKTAARLAADQQAFEDARQKERLAEADILDAVREAVRPALRALCAPVRVSWFRQNSREPGGRAEETAGVGFRAVWVAGDDGGPGPFEDGPDPLRGEYGGDDLFLTEEGGWVRLEYAGRWSRVPGESSSWKATAHHLDTIHAAEDRDPDQVIERLGRALAAQVSGARAQRTREILWRAEQLGLLAKLVRGSL